jgi:hypothetical protein
MTGRYTGVVLGLGLLAGLLLAPAAQATGNNVLSNGLDLLTACRDAIRAHEAGVFTSIQQAYHTGLCDGYIGGEISAAGNEPFPSFCLTTGGTTKLEQIARIIVRYLDTHPERLHLEREQLFIEAMQQAFPCPTPPTQPARQR